MQDFIEFKNNKVYYSSEGKGNVVLLLHGFLENSSMWKELSEELVKKHRVICVDLLGHGKTGCIGYVHTMEEMADAVNEVLKSLQIGKATIIGHSMGGYVGLAFAEKYIEKVTGICLLNSTSQADSEERKELRLRACRMAQTNYEALVKMSITNLFAETSRITFAKEIEVIKKDALKTPVQGYIAATKGMRERKNRETVLKKIEKRLIISGEKDPILHKEFLVLEATRTKTPITFLPLGHMSYIESNKDLTSKIKEFLN
ncbi:Pimeloyl-ACP methyl ester carboxylesterase [Tenacibaculum sp. 190130A14a]